MLRRSLRSLRSLVAIAAAAAVTPILAPAQYGHVRDLHNECPYLGYLTAFSTPDTLEHDYGGVPQSWGSNALTHATNARIALGRHQTVPFTLGAGGRHGFWRHQTAWEVPYSVLELGTDRTNADVTAPARIHTARVFLDVWLETNDLECVQTSTFAASTHPRGRVLANAALGTNADVVTNYQATMVSHFDALPGANNAWRVTNGVGISGANQTTSFSIGGELSAGQNGGASISGGISITWEDGELPGDAPHGWMYVNETAKTDRKRATELHAIYVSLVQTQARLDNGPGQARFILAIWDCHPWAHICWGGTTSSPAPEIIEIDPPAHGPQGPGETPAPGEVLQGRPPDFNCTDFFSFLREVKP